jgi:hypothetical protein
VRRGLWREREREGCGYGGVVLLPERRPLRGLRAVPERGHLARMPVSALLHALVLQRGNARLLSRCAQSDFVLGFAISSFESSAARFEPLRIFSFEEC